MVSQTHASQLTLPASEQRDHIRGPLDAPVTLVEYGDYQCPFCGQAHGILHELMTQLANDMRLVFRNFPLTQIHPFAQRAAEAAEAAGAQGRFWNMHDMLYENQDALDNESLREYAAELGLDVDRFGSELTSGVHVPRIREDFASGVRSGVNGTPTFFINGRRHDGPWDLRSLALAVNRARAEPVSAGSRPAGRRIS
ncbi:MAG: DsbA family protein [Phycisphaerales bacterium]|nr:DsbA family protein [Phycisphaerales bacterium]